METTEQPKPVEFSELDVGNMTLPQRLDVMRQVDEGAIVATTEQLKSLGEMVREKADAYHDVYLNMVADLKKIDLKLEPWLAHRKSIIRDIENFQSLLHFVMEKNDWQEIPGNDYRITAGRDTERLKEKAKPDKSFYAKFGEFMRVKYEWKKKEMKEALKKDPSHDISMYAEIETVKHAKLDINAKRSVKK